MGSVSGRSEIEDRQERQRLYGEYLKQANALGMTLSQSLSKAILTLSSGALGLSAGFISTREGVVCLLLLSWFAFVASILSVLVGYFLNLASAKYSIPKWKAYYDNPEMVDPPNSENDSLYRWSYGMLVTSAVLFCLGAILTVVYLGGTLNV